MNREREKPFLRLEEKKWEKGMNIHEFIVQEIPVDLIFFYAVGST